MIDTSSSELQYVLNATPLIFFQKDTQNRIVRTNQTVADMLHTSVDSIVGTSTQQWFPDEADGYFSDDLKVMRSGQPRLSIIEQLDMPDCGKQWVSTDKHPHYDERGKVDGVLVFCRRVDGKTLAEEQRSQLEAQVRYAQKLDSIGILAAGIAHDFNNYLTIIIAGTEMALERVGRGCPEALPLEESLKATHEAARIANQLVKYAGKSLVVSKPVNLSTLIDEFSDMLYASIAKRVDLSFKLDFDIPAINADKAQLHQLLVNVVVNASEAIGEQHGRICISTSERQCSSRELLNTVVGATLEAGRYVVVTIKDSGSGMSSGVLKSVFEPFFSTKKSGRGLGLATVIGTVKEHGGTLSVDSTEGRGTIIELLFPALGGTASSESRGFGGHSVSARAGLAGQTKTRLCTSGVVHNILIVDDNQAVRGILQTFLESDGFRVFSATDADEALGLLQMDDARISAAIVDYCMPETNGLELFEQFRKLQPELPFILVSGSAYLMATTPFESLPDVAFVQKPFDRATILQKLHNLLDHTAADRP